MNIENITDPSFLQRLDYKELDALCQDIRSFIIRSVSQTGGHLSSNLGVVELTVALHRVFDFSRDKLIFDIGHQSYTHKILTGRAPRFGTLRALDGLSGFQSIEESPYDCYEGGHSSTSLSAALGFALARDLHHGNENVVAVIGDGSIGNGVAYEALNHIGDYSGPLIVILNDNEMSINQNVGAMHNLLEQIRVTEGYTRKKQQTKQALGKIPVVGKPLVQAIGAAKDTAKRFYALSGSIFEDLGFNYYGPVNGHDIRELERYLRTARESETPVLLHVFTQKGRGYRFCQNDTEGRWHGVGRFNIKTGETGDSTGYSKVVSDALMTLAERDPEIVAITPAMATGARLLDFRERFPDRFIDAGIAEEHALILANAMAQQGAKPFISIYSTFLQRGYDQMLHDIARMHGHVVVGVDRCGIIGEDGISHQGIYDVSFLLPIPGLVIAQPRNAAEATRLLAMGLGYNSPFVLRYSKNHIVPMPADFTPVPIGSWETLAEGADATIISYGDFLQNAMEIRGSLEKDGIHLAVINARFLKPIDSALFERILSEKKPIFIYEEATKIGSLGSFLAEYAADARAENQIHLFAVEDRFVAHGKREEVLRRLGLDSETVRDKIKALLK